MPMPGDERQTRELRVNIDALVHQKLHMLKVLRNKTLSDAVHEALEQYLAGVVAREMPVGREMPIGREVPVARERTGATSAEEARADRDPKWMGRL